MITKCSGQQLEFQGFGKRKFIVTSDAEVTSSAGIGRADILIPQTEGNFVPDSAIGEAVEQRSYQYLVKN